MCLLVRPLITLESLVVVGVVGIVVQQDAKQMLFIR